MMLPVSDALTTLSSPRKSANRAMISSAALPNVALSSPPSPGPSRSARFSVDLAHQTGQRDDGQAGGQELPGLRRPGHLEQRPRPAAPGTGHAGPPYSAQVTRTWWATRRTARGPGSLTRSRATL